MNYLKYITASIRNKPGRNVAVAFCFAVIAVNIFSGQYLMAGTAGSIDQGISRMGADNVVVPLEYLVIFKRCRTAEYICNYQGRTICLSCQCKHNG